MRARRALVRVRHAPAFFLRRARSNPSTPPTHPPTQNTHTKVAAVDEPKLHLWETGIMRVTRHPQMVGQALWCAAHTLWVGSSVMVAASAGLMAHHLFAVWHGDKRLRDKYGEVRW